jgi:RimJ/RimL family protein N-acetyltransferase
MKCPLIKDARAQSLKVSSRGLEECQMIPVGPWVLSQKALLQKMAIWRESARESFFARFPSSVDSTSDYITRYSLALPDRILFLLESRGVFVGHVGLSNMVGDSAEIDNVIRGEPVDSPSFMADSLRTMVRWATSAQGVKRFRLRVLSNNLRAIDLYESLGFRLVKSEPLTVQRVSEGGIHLVPCTSSEATIPEKSNLMEYIPPESLGGQID